MIEVRYQTSDIRHQTALKDCLPAGCVILSDSEESRYKLLMRQMQLNTGRRGDCRLAVSSASSVISSRSLVHPCATSWPSSPRWEACHLILRSLRSLTNQVPLPPKGDARRYGIGLFPKTWEAGGTGVIGARDFFSWLIYDTAVFTLNS